VISITLRTTGTVSKSFGKYLSHKPGKNDIKEIYKTAILDAGHYTHTAGNTDVKVNNFYRGK
jgi:hypothetical protein